MESGVPVGGYKMYPVFQIVPLDELFYLLAGIMAVGAVQELIIPGI
jgi:hypothetical protein